MEPFDTADSHRDRPGDSRQLHPRDHRHPDRAGDAASCRASARDASSRTGRGCSWPAARRARACQPCSMAPWKLPLVVAAIVVPIVGRLPRRRAGARGRGRRACGGGARRRRGAGSARAGRSARRRRRRAPACSARRHRRGRGPDDVARIAAAAGLDGRTASAEVLVLAPARIGFLDRWASDVEAARQRRQQTWSRRSRRWPRPA